MNILNKEVKYSILFLHSALTTNYGNEEEWRTQNPVKHLRWGVLRKLLTGFGC